MFIKKISLFIYIVALFSANMVLSIHGMEKEKNMCLKSLQNLLRDLHCSTKHRSLEPLKIILAQNQSLWRPYVFMVSLHLTDHLMKQLDKVQTNHKGTQQTSDLISIAGTFKQFFMCLFKQEESAFMKAWINLTKDLSKLRASASYTKQETIEKLGEAIASFQDHLEKILEKINEEIAARILL